MTSPNTHHHGHPDTNPDLHPAAPSSHQPQPSYQPLPPEAESSSPPSHSPQTSPLHLPTSRQFLTSLITAISNIPLLSSEPPTRICKPAESPTTKEREHTTTTETNRRKQLLQILKEEGEGDGEGQERQGDTTSKAKTKKSGDHVNPLKLVPPEYRHLIITLHVLFPGVVLPGLEVLERGLVERVVLRSVSSGKGDGDRREGTRTVGEVKEEQEAKRDADVIMGERDEDMNRDHDGDEKQDMNQDGEENVDNKNLKPTLNKSQKESKAKGRRPPQFYLVRSSQYLNTHPRRKRKKSNMGLGDADTEGIPSGVSEAEQHRIQRYIVNLEAWNCTCAAFAFACVSEPAAGEGEREGDGDGEGRGKEGGVKELREGIEELRARERERDKVGSAGWTFGGMTLFDARDHSSVPPVCKHLLACLLADKWRRALGRYVTERMVGREEMAGIVADV